MTSLMLGVQQPVVSQTLNSGLPDVVDFAQHAPVNPGDSTSFAGVATVTIGNDHTTITSTHNPVTGDIDTKVRDKFGAPASESHSKIVPGTGGLTRDTTIIDKSGVSRIRTVDDGQGNLITWTANPDGSHSVHYHKSNIIVVEPAPGSSTPTQIIQLSPDGTSGHVTMWHSDGSTSSADFRPSLFGTPVTEYTSSDGSSLEILTVPASNGQPISIVTDAMGNRAVVQPDGTTTAVDKYNKALGGPWHGNKFDPSSATWVTDPITSRGPMVRVPDGTSIQKWYGRKPDGSKYELDAYFDEQGNLRGIGNSDSKGIKYTSYGSIDGIFVPTDTLDLDAGNAIDNRQLVYDAVMVVFGIPELAILGTRLGVGIGGRYFGSQLAGHGASLTGRELAVAGLGAGDALTGLAGGARAAKNPTFPSSTPQVQALRPSPAPGRPQQAQLSANAPKLRPSSPAQSPISVAVSVPRDVYLRPGMGVPLSQTLKSEAQIGQAVRDLNMQVEQLLMFEARAKTLANAGARNTSPRSQLSSSLSSGPGTTSVSASNASATSGVGSGKVGYSGKQTNSIPSNNTSSPKSSGPVGRRPNLWPNAETWLHIDRGELKHGGRATGYHHRPDGKDRYGVRVTNRTAPNRQGVYEGTVHMDRWTGSEWVTKRGISTFFPDSWTKAQVQRAVEAASRNVKRVDGNYWEGYYRGLRIGGYFDLSTGRIITAYPILKNK
ncbi:EndoU domain-containing protein [Nocardia sp. NPDC060259]|uniref:EndoU domain-containing protein n=1 Tax=Nocardia sp. NPDC060259 TaxID=3347088 RepID=UPI00365F5AC5